MNSGGQAVAGQLPQAPTGLSHLWASWRAKFVSNPDSKGSICTFCEILGSGQDDRQTLIIRRFERCFAILNAYPYTSGHLMIIPYRHVAGLAELTDAEHSEMFERLKDAVAAIESAYRPDGLNVGMNLGHAAGAGIPGHLHLHVVPRWAGDTNFTTAIAETRVMPESLDTSYSKLDLAWPKISE